MKQPSIFEIDELARSVAYDFGTVEKVDEHEVIRWAHVEPFGDGSTQYLDLEFTSQRNWNLYTDGGRNTRRGIPVIGEVYARFAGGILIERADNVMALRHNGSPMEVRNEMINMYEGRKYDQSTHISKAGPLRLKRLYSLLDAMSLELTNQRSSLMR